MTEPVEDADAVAGPTEITEVSLEVLEAVSGGGIEDFNFTLG